MGCPMLAVYQGCHGKQIRGIRDLCAVVSYDLAGAVEVWWDGSHYWSAAVVGHNLFRKDKVMRR